MAKVTWYVVPRLALIFPEPPCLYFRSSFLLPTKTTDHFVFILLRLFPSPWTFLVHKLLVSSLCLVSCSQGSFPTRLGFGSLICKSGVWQGYKKSSSESRPKTTHTHTHTHCPHAAVSLPSQSRGSRSPCSRSHVDNPCDSIRHLWSGLMSACLILWFPHVLEDHCHSPAFFFPTIWWLINWSPLWRVLATDYPAAPSSLGWLVYGVVVNQNLCLRSQ